MGMLERSRRVRVQKLFGAAKVERSASVLTTSASSDSGECWKSSLSLLRGKVRKRERLSTVSCPR